MKTVKVNISDVDAAEFLGSLCLRAGSPLLHADPPAARKEKGLSNQKPFYFSGMLTSAESVPSSWN